MAKKPARLLIASAAFAALFFGPGLSRASAWQPSVALSGRFVGPGVSFDHRAFFGPGHAFLGHRFRPAHRFFARPFHRRFRFVRVRVFDPFPHFVWRRIHFAPPLAGRFCAPY